MAKHNARYTLPLVIVAGLLIFAAGLKVATPVRAQETSQ